MARLGRPPSSRAGERRLLAQRETIERHLMEAGARLTRAREELAALDEQVAWFAEATDDARTRALVTDAEAEKREAADAERHLHAMNRSRADLADHIDRLRRLQEELLEELPESGAPS
jgi:chromosome segregation ATPase